MAKYQKEDLKIYLKRKDGEHRTKFKEALSHFKNCLRNDNFSKEDIKDLLATRYNDKCVASVGQGFLTEQQAYQNWESIYKTIQEFDFKKDTTEILSNKYDKLLETVSNGCKTKKPIITNRLLATFFYEYVTATCNKDDFKTIADFMYKNFENYPKPHKRDYWLLNNLDFVKYCRESLEEDYDPLLISYSWDLYQDIQNGKINKLLEDKTMTDKNTNASVLAKNLAELLKNTKNLILHGAPGTGKTYLAKDIAAYMNFDKLHSELNDEEEKKFSEHTCFVQFHPSYDYTDFVEGIRPTPDGKFKPENGIFKKFCEKAINNSENTQKNITDANSSYSYLLKALKDFVNELDNKIPKNKISRHLSESMKFFKDKLKTFESSTNNAYYVKDLFLLKIELNWFNEEFRKEIKSDDELQTTSLIYKENPIIGNLKKELQNCINNLNLQNDLSTCWDLLIYEVSKHNINNPLKIDKYYFIKSPKAESLKKLNKEGTDVINTTIPLKRIKEVYEGKSDSKKYYHKPGKSIIDYMSKYKLESYEALQLADDAFNESTKKTPEHSENKNSFIFIIDEINRGEISKIFGELFFAIDPGYRGKKGKIKTQYANMQDSPNKFDKALGINDRDNFGHFFVPDNVYIIGTMNDIDRSVESMDFAMRRRFTFKEITAEKSAEAILTPENLEGGTETDIKSLKNRMKNLNDVINEIGLSSGYQIGAAYFLKYVNYLEEEKTFEALWNYNLEPLLREYLRGQGDVENKLKQLKKAYENESEQEKNEQNAEASK